MRLSQVTRQLRMDGWPALSIHGDKSQQERDWVLGVSSSVISGKTGDLDNMMAHLVDLNNQRGFPAQHHTADALLLQHWLCNCQ